MLTSLSFVFLLGLAMAALCQKFKIPRIIGMLVTGILLGPCVLNWLSESILGISSELRQMALIIILLKAGLSLNLADLKKVGRPALMMSCVPASFEILAFVIFAPAILHICGSGCNGSCFRRSVTGSCDPANGSADGDKIWNRPENSADDHGRCIL